MSGLLIHAAVGSLGRGGRSADEPLGMALVGGVEHEAACGVESLGVSVVDGGRAAAPSTAAPFVLVSNIPAFSVLALKVH